MRSAFGAFSLFTYSMTLIPSFFSSSHLSSLSDPFPLNSNPSFVVSLPTLSLYPRSPSLPLSHYPHSFLSLLSCECRYKLRNEWRELRFCLRTSGELLPKFNCLEETWAQRKLLCVFSQRTFNMNGATTKLSTDR